MIFALYFMFEDGLFELFSSISTCTTFNTFQQNDNSVYLKRFFNGK